MTSPLLPLKRVLSRNDGGVWGEDPDGVSDTVVLRSTDQSTDGKWLSVDPAMRRLSPVERVKATLALGDLLVTKSSGSTSHIGKTTLTDAGIAESRPTYSNFMQRLRLAPGNDPKFFWFCFRSEFVREQLNLSSTTSTGLANLTSSTIGELIFPVPSLTEQRQIAGYLDAQTAKIDALIGKQERLIEMLAERRQAVISHAVTKGLDPTAPVKDSGVEWLGHVPDHWVVTVVKRAYSVTLGKMLDAARAERVGDEQLPYIRAANIQERGLDLVDVNTMPFTPTEQVSLSLKASDLLVVEGGAVGVCVLLKDDIAGWSFQKTVNRVRPREDNSTAFLGHFLDAIRLGGVIDMLCNKSTIAHFTAEKLNATELALPPATEQREIVTHLDHETSRIDALSAKARAMIVVLKERRQALISAAVTGKIDVREQRLTHEST